MKQAQHLNLKANFDIRKRPINGKLFQNQKTTKEQFTLNTKKTMGKKYMQQHNIFKQKHDEPKKQHRQIVMSEQFIRSSKLYRLLKQKMDRCDSIFIKQVNAVNDHKMKMKEQIMQIKSENYQQKVQLWELKNKLMELKIMYHEEEEESKRLAEQNIEEYDGEEQYQEGDEGQNNEDNNKQSEYVQYNKEEGQVDEKDLVKSEEVQLDSNMEQAYQQVGQMEASQQNKSQFAQILEELMSLKSERKHIQKELFESQMDQSKEQKLQSHIHQKKCSFSKEAQPYPQ